MAADKAEKRIADLEKKIDRVIKETRKYIDEANKKQDIDRKDIEKWMNDEVGNANDGFKDAKKYIDEANKKQDADRKDIEKWMNDEVGNANDGFKDAKKYIDNANKKQDAVFKKFDDRIKAIEKQLKKK